MGGLLHVGIKECELPVGAPSPRDQRVVGEPIRSLCTRYNPINAISDELIGFRPKRMGVTIVTIAGGGTAILIIGDTVQITYNDGVNLAAAIRAAVIGDPVATDMVEVIADLGSVVPLLGPTASFGVNLWTDEIAVPGASYRLDAEGRWVPWDGAITGGAAMLAALLAIQANTSPDNRNSGVTHSLDNGGAAFVDHSLGISGRTLSVDGLTGTASIRLVVGGVPYPTLPAPARDIFPLDRWFHDFTDVLLSCVSQPGKTISLYAGWRV